MTNDITGVLHELRAAYRAYQSAKRDHKERIREKYETVIADEVRKAVESEKYNFSSLLRDRKERFSLRVTDIQDHVLRTRNWKVWEELRDYADIQPEQVTRDNAREEAKRPYRWDRVEYRGEEREALVWLKDPKGKKAEQPIHIVIDPLSIEHPDWISDELPYILSLWSNRNNLLEHARPVIIERFKKED